MENFPNLENNTSTRNNKIKYFIISVFVFLVLLFSYFYFFLFQAPASFKTDQIFVIEKGSSVRSVSLKLKNEGFIESRVFFESFIIIFGGEKNISSGDYLFKEKLSVLELANRIAKGEKGISPIRVTIPEGYSISEIAETFAVKLHNFNKDNFINQSRDKEGYFFPDTYFFLSSDNEEVVIKMMNNNFAKRTEKIFSIFDNLPNKDERIKEILIMASLIEGEASGDNDRETISGILWKRLEINMPLQVDVAPITYEERGLPDDPISNPGLKAILAAMNPKISPYLYYIHDKKGDTYFARTFKEHRDNIEKYLK
ncbi:MAG: endolytic transglycosylase MltG [Candidatus Paceibacterota bacterium]